MADIYILKEVSFPKAETTCKKKRKEGAQVLLRTMKRHTKLYRKSTPGNTEGGKDGGQAGQP